MNTTAYPFRTSPKVLQLIEDGVLIRSLLQYRETLEALNGHDPELASKLTEALECYEEEAQRRGLEVQRTEA